MSSYSTSGCIVDIRHLFQATTISKQLLLVDLLHIQSQCCLTPAAQMSLHGQLGALLGCQHLVQPVTCHPSTSAESQGTVAINPLPESPSHLCPPLKQLGDKQPYECQRACSDLNIGVGTTVSKIDQGNGKGLARVGQWRRVGTCRRSSNNHSPLHELHPNYTVTWSTTVK